ncbi:carbohydrate binding protein with CBM6 domain [Mucilaginibacter yixingensis]|uniref:Carbohydrate binding protein with CBM6 domain n=1 Tax=Mucilaginibacter yixingensis TaxID=1295612 RepID=A0A2T5J6U3_9SPHI|nr:cellulase family glycosylhydrolase [Mucilaginibacter yixingensis]PTQ94870.1 carbohydrate binding protein with CBM6 domain [Mucilaginibacter yixingensis]
MYQHKLKYILGAACLFAMQQAHSQGFLKADGKLIVNEKGQKVILRGVGLGGDMLQEGYMFRLGNIGQQHKIKAGIEDLIGPEKTKTFYEKWLANNTRKIDVDSMARWGFNSIRLPMHFNLFTLPVEEEPVAGQNTWLDKGFNMVDDLLKWCKANHMYLILDLHATPGGQGNDLPISDRYPEKPSLWQSEANQQKMVALWHKLAQRYANEPNIGGYDIINEPNWGFDDAKDIRGTAEKTNAPLKKLMMEVTAAIREVDKKHIVIIEGNGFGNNYNGILPAWDNNMVLSFHKYGNFNSQKAIQGFLDLREKYNVPLWMGESGENSNTWFTEAIGLVERNNIGWSWWPWKKMGINNPVAIKQPEGWQKLVDYWAGRGAKPSSEEAQKTLDQLLENLKFENNIKHPDVVDALFRQVQSAETKPFINLTIQGKSTVINAADFDMGRQRSAYYDKDTSSYQFTPGVNTQGNRGHAYRNDGVDIKVDDNGPYVFNIEEGEWMQYTVNVKQAGTYSVKLTVSADNGDGRLSLLNGFDKLTDTQIIPNTGGVDKWSTIKIKDIKLKAGVQQLRVLVDKGGFQLRSMTFEKE